MNRVPTFPRLEAASVVTMEQKITAASRRLPVGVVIPSLYTDLVSPAMAGIIRELSTMNFIRRVYISLDCAGPDEFAEAKSIVAPLGDKAALLWNDSPGVREVAQRIETQLPLGPRGKGRAVWLALGYVLGKGEVSVIAFHDADVVTYDREFLIRLIYLVVMQRYQFAKGFYARHASKLYGRVVRLFYFPFVRTLRDIFGPVEFLEYMADFRYPLSGEFATFVSIAREMRFPSDWGIEVGVLGEIYRLVRVPRVCQVELTARYDHKHQSRGENTDQGLLKMASDIARTFFTHMAGQSFVLNDEFYNTLKLTYLTHAREYVDVYENLSKMHGTLTFDLHEELSTVELFATAIEGALQDFRSHSFGSPMIPDWRRVDVAMDGITRSLVEAYESAT
jgi:glucosyl-3-phosphoglycerate synthase